MKTAKQKCAAIVQVIKPYVKTLLLATAYAELERERVDKIQRELLAAQNYYGRDHDGNQYRVTEPGDFRMDDQSSKVYHDKLNAIHLAAGFADAAKGFCPALVAEHNKTKAEWALIEAAEAFFPECTNNALICGFKRDGKHVCGLKVRKEYLDLLIGMTVNFK